MQKRNLDQFRTILQEKLFCDYPVLADQETYNQAITEYLKYIEIYKHEIHSIYQIGAVKHFGISDIDFFVVFKDKKFSDYNKFTINGISEKSKNIFSHNPIFFSKNEVEDINSIYPVFSFNKIYGEEIKIKQNKINSNILASVMFLCKIPYNLVAMINSKKQLPIRDCLCLIYSMKYTIELLYHGGIAKQEKWDKLIQTIITIRANWFKDIKESEKQLLTCIVDALEVSIQMIELYSNNLKKLKITCNNTNFAVSNSNFKFKFTDKWSEELMLKNINSFPIEFGYYIYLWTKDKNDIGNQFKYNEKVEYSIPLEIIESMDIHKKVVLNFHDFYKKKFFRPGYHYITLGSKYSSSLIKNIYAKGKRAYGKIRK